VTVRRWLPIFSLVSLVATGSGCAGGLVAKPPTPEDEVARLKREITKVRFAIDSTKELIDRSRGQPYLADLYLRLAELYVEEARNHYFIAYEGTKRRERAVTSVQARLLKNQAVGVYKRILDEFPQYADRDKVLFFVAHEYRELGEYPEMLKYLERVIAEHEQSAYRNESLLVVGDYYFDQGDLKASEKYYKRILETAESGSHAMARYKLGWVKINEEDMKGALRLFEDTIEGLAKQEEAAKSGSTKAVAISAKKIDLRREALADLVFPWTEVNKKNVDVPKALRYFRNLADARTSYLAALSKLARRWFVKGEYNLASQVYRELLALGAQDDDTLEWARRLYDGAAKGQQYAYVAKDVAILADIGARRYYDWRLPEKEREHLYREFEAYCRDLSTKTQIFAASSNDAKLQQLAGDAYESYLASFGQTLAAAEIRQNLADARFAAKQFFLAGRAYEAVMDGLKTSTTAVKPEDTKEAVYTAVVAYNNALKEPAKLGRLELVQARAGLRRAARIYVGDYPQDANRIAVKFNFAKSYYDEGLFDEASEYFAALVEEFPASNEANIAAELALDALRVQEKFEEMAQVGKRFAGNAQLSATVRQELSQIVESAEGRALEVATLQAGYAGDAAVDGLLQFADRHQGSELGEKALINAFATARNSDDLDKVAKIGQQLIQQYPQSKVVPDVLATLGNMSAQAVDFDRAAKYLEEAARHGTAGEGSAEMLRASAVIKAHLGDVEGAKQNYEKVIQAAQPGQAKRDAALGLADILERAGDYRAATSALQTAATEGARSAAIEYRLGYALMQAGRGAEAGRAFANASELGSASSDPEDREGAAGARYYLSQGVITEYEAVGFDGNTAQSIQKKFAALASAEGELVAVIELQSPKWALASLARLASVYGHGAEFLSKAPAPAGLDEAGAEKFKAALGARANELRGKSEEAKSTCAAKALELQVFTQAARACLLGEALDPDPERRVAPPQRRGAPPAGPVGELQKRIAKNSKDYQALGELATLYLSVADPYAAKLVLDKAAEGGASSEVYNLRGVVAFALGYPQLAYDEFQSALKADPTNAKARVNVAGLYSAYGMAKLAEAETVKITAGTRFDGSDPAIIAPARSVSVGGGAAGGAR
jgi:Flp pilus assembly protein TadD